jgi:signal transduction histidine kinase
MTDARRMSLFRYWTGAYFVTLFAGLLIFSGLAIVLIQHTTKHSRLHMMESVAQQFALRVVDPQGSFRDDRSLDQIMKQLLREANWNGFMPFMVMDTAGHQLFPIVLIPDERAPNNVPAPQGDTPGPPPIQPIMQRIFHANPAPKALTVSVQVLPQFGRIHFVQVPVLRQGVTAASVLLAMTDDDADQLNIPYSMLIPLLCLTLLLGWGTIFALTKRLLRPIQEVAEAANAMASGRYDIEINTRAREKEVYDMLHAIRTMAAKIQQLESLRTVLLAGVTHDLKTPIASISGLIQAVKDDVVHGEEQEEFLALSIQEAQRLQRMVEDLLDFNGFATGALKVSMEEVDLPRFAAEAVHQWQMADDRHRRFQVAVRDEGCPDRVRGDSVRMQQILDNLLNNASHAVADNGSITIILYDHDERFAGIDIADNGKGIPREEVPFIFERFYRGAGKKYQVRGMGLGLPFSLMLAKAQGGELTLKRTSQEGTTFTLLLPKPNIS